MSRRSWSPEERDFVMVSGACLLAITIFLGTLTAAFWGLGVRKARGSCAHEPSMSLGDDPKQPPPYCGCPNKVQCAFDAAEDCGSCCGSGKCPGGPPTNVR